ncbi:hypothetical protein, partial [Pseudomonas syringae group genomosp. 7]
GWVFFLVLLGLFLFGLGPFWGFWFNILVFFLVVCGFVFFFGFCRVGGFFFWFCGAFVEGWLVGAAVFSAGGASGFWFVGFGLWAGGGGGS